MFCHNKKKKKRKGKEEAPRHNDLMHQGGPPCSAEARRWIRAGGRGCGCRGQGHVRPQADVNVRS